MATEKWKRVVIEVGGKKLHLVLYGTYEEWENKYGDKFCWDIMLEELLDGTLEINEGIWYWLIDGRCYETDEEDVKQVINE